MLTNFFLPLLFSQTYATVQGLTNSNCLMDQPYFRTDYYRPPPGTSVITPEQEQHDAVAASREASKEEMAQLRALGRPRVAQPKLPPIKAPSLPQDFTQRVAALDEEIYGKGVAVDSDKLLERGKELFAQLLEGDRKARAWQLPILDLTNSESVQYGLQAFEASVIPARTMVEQAAGWGKERDQARRITGVNDLWKSTQERVEVLRDIYTFHDLFATLCFGQSLLERLSSDGQLRSRFLCGGRGAKVDLFRDWLSVLQEPFTSVTLAQPLFSVMAWLADEQAEPSSHTDLARDFFNVRVPSLKQERIAAAILDGFLLDYRDWQLWEYVGRATRAIPDMSQLSGWRTQLAKRYLGITSFQAEVSAAFWRDVGYGGDSHRQFELARYRAFVSQVVQQLLACVSAVLALAIKESGAAIAARFEAQVLCEAQPKQRAKISAQLAAAFPSATFPIVFEEVQS